MKDFHFSIDSNLAGQVSVSQSAKLLYANIFALSGKGFCYASNDNLAKTIGVSQRTVKRLVRELIEKGYIKRDIECEKGKNKTHKLHPLIKLKVVTKMTPGGVKNDTRGGDKNDTYKEEYNLKREFKNSAGARGEGIIKKSYTSEQLNARLDSLTYDDL